jgi:two-component system response regulator MprA
VSQTPLRILVVEDESGIRETMLEILAEEGYEVTTAADGVAALDAVTRARPDAILLDLMLPQLDGFGVVAELRQRGCIPVSRSSSRPRTATRGRAPSGSVRSIGSPSRSRSTIC